MKVHGPATFSEAMDLMVGVAGAAIAMMFAAVGAVMVIGLAFTAAFEIVQWFLS
jgi:hypothetical protein